MIVPVNNDRKMYQRTKNKIVSVYKEEINVPAYGNEERYD